MLMESRPTRSLVRLTLTSLALWLLAACAPSASLNGAPADEPSPWFSVSSRESGHTLRIHLNADESSDTLSGLAKSAVQEVNRRISPTGEGSVLAAVNREAGQMSVKVPEDLRVLVRRALAFHRLTDGAVDATDGSLRALWAGGKTPSSETVRAALDKTGSQVISVDEFEGTLHIQRSGVALDLGAMGRAYALAVASQRLETAGAARYRLDYGSLSVLGYDDRRLWKLPLPDGPGTPPRAHRWARVRGGAVSTLSRADGARGPLFDVIDPRTGSPVRTLSFVLVVSSDPVQSAAIAQALAVLGRTRGLEIVETLEGVEGLVIDLAGYVHASSGLSSEVIQEPIGGAATADRR